MSNQHALSKWLGTASGWQCRYFNTTIAADEAPKFDKTIIYKIGDKDTFEGNLDELVKYLDDNKEKFNE